MARCAKSLVKYTCINVYVYIYLWRHNLGLLLILSHGLMRIRLFYFFHPIYYLHPYFLTPSSLSAVVTQIRGLVHSRRFSPPPHYTTVHALRFYRENTSAISSLVDLRRIAHTHVTRSHQLVPFFFVLLINRLKIPPLRESNSGLTSTVVSIAFEGNHY